MIPWPWQEDALLSRRIACKTLIADDLSDVVPWSPTICFDVTQGVADHSYRVNEWWPTKLFTQIAYVGFDHIGIPEKVAAPYMVKYLRL